MTKKFYTNHPQLFSVTVLHKELEILKNPIEY